MTKENSVIRESLFTEMLMSVIFCMAFQSCLMIIRGFIIHIDINVYQSFIPLILAAFHTFVRRKWTDIMPCLIIHILSAAIFFCVVICIPQTGFGHSRYNMAYLAINLLVVTFFSFNYRLNPKVHPTDSQVIAFPACLFPICGIFYVMMNRDDLIANLVINTILSAALYLVLRQVAIFDDKYYHAIRSSSRPASHLKRQNYKTAACLVGIFALSLIVIRLVPLDLLTNIVMYGIKAVLRVVVLIIFAIIDFFAKFLSETRYDQPEEEDNAIEELLTNDSPVFRVISIILAILILIGFALLVLNSIRLLIMNAPRLTKEKESVNDGVVTDTIEMLKPDRKPLFRRRPDFGKGYERRIRKQFYDKTMSAMHKDLPVGPSSTPGQIEKVLTANGDKEFASLRQEYEKIRYGN
jgi:hypothetical protein